MKYKLIVVIYIFLSAFFSELNAENFKTTSVGAGLMYGNQPETESFSLEIKKTELINRSLIVGFDTFISTSFEDNTAGIIAVKPNVGFFILGDKRSEFTILLSASSGLAVTSYESKALEDDSYFGTFSTLDLHFIYKSFGLTLTGFSVNTGNYYNSGLNVGLKFWFE
jgi:hypothetical protein